MKVRVGALLPGTRFVTALTRTSGSVKPVIVTGGKFAAGVWVELANPFEIKSIHEDVCVEVENIH